MTSPAWSSVQYQLERSPRSRPMVNLRSKFRLLYAAAVLLFFIAGLLYLLRFERVDNLGAYSIPPGDRPSHSICYHSLSFCMEYSSSASKGNCNFPAARESYLPPT